MNLWTRRALTLVLVCAIVLLLVAAAVWHNLWSRYDNAQQQLESRAERLDGIIAAAPDIRALLDTLGSSVTPLVHPDSAGAQNEIQQQLRELITASGATLVSSQIAAEPAEENQFARVRLTATVTGEWGRLLRFMEALQTHAPVFWVRTARIMREGPNTGARGQNMRITLQLEAPLAPALDTEGPPT